MVIGLTAGSVWSNDVASGRSTRRFASCGMNCSIGSSQLEATFFEEKKRSAGCNQLCIREDAEYVVDPQWYLRFHVGPSNACHVYQISADEHRGRESGKKIAINVPLHGSVRGPP